MTVDDRLRAAHARIPEPDTATITRARARLTAALGDAPGAPAAGASWSEEAPRERGGESRGVAPLAPDRDGRAPDRDGRAPDRDGRAPDRDGRAPTRDGLAPDRDGLAPDRDGLAPDRDGRAPDRDGRAPDRDGGPAVLAPIPRRRRRPLAVVLPVVALAVAAAAVVALVGAGGDARREREAVPPAAQTPDRVGGPVAYERNTFAVSIRYISAEGSSTASPANAAYGIARSVPEEIWRAPDGSGRIEYGADSAPYLPSPADERAWRAAGSPDLEKLAGDPGRWGPKKQTFGPGGLDEALLLNSNLEAVLPKRDPLSVVPHDPTELAAWLEAAAARQRPGAPDRVVRDAVISDALTFLRDARAPHDLRVALIEVLSGLDGARSLPEIRDAAGRKWPGIELADRTVLAYDPDSCRLMARGTRYEDGVRWNLTYAVESAGVAAIGDRP